LNYPSKEIIVNEISRLDDDYWADNKHGILSPAGLDTCLQYDKRIAWLSSAIANLNIALIQLWSDEKMSLQFHGLFGRGR
jgi:hypothetical protein